MSGAAPRRAFPLGMSLAVLLGLQASAQHAYGALAPSIRDDLGAGADEMGLIAGALYLGTVLAAFGLGGWVDRRSPPRVTMMSAVAIAASLLFIAGARTLPLVALGYLLVGLGRGAIPPLTDRIGYELAPEHQRGLVFGIKQTGTPLGAVLAAVVLAPIAAGALGWRGAIIILAVGMVVGYAAVARTLPTSPAPAAGTVPDRTSRTVIVRLTRRLGVPMTLSFGLGIHQATVVTFLTLYLVDVAQLTAVRAARWFALLSIGGAAGRILWGWMSDRLFGGRRALVLAASAVLAGAMALVVGRVPSLLVGASGAALIAFYGLLSQGWIGISRAWGAELAGPGLSGRAGGILLGSMMLGGLLGPPVFGRIVESAGGYRTAWTTLGVITMFSGVLALWGALQEERSRARGRHARAGLADHGSTATSTPSPDGRKATS